MKKLILTLTLLVGFAMQALAYDFQSGDLLYTIISINPPCVSVVGHVDGENAQGELDIPFTVTYEDETYTVTEIWRMGFYELCGSDRFYVTINYRHNSGRSILWLLRLYWHP